MHAPLRPALLLVASVAAPAAAQRLDYSPVEDEDLAAPARLAYQAVDVPDPAVEQAAPVHRRKWLQWGLLDRFEYAAQRSEDGFAWDFSALLGGTRNRLWVGSTGEGPAWAAPDYHELHLLYSRNLGGPVDLNAGARWDAQSGPDRIYGVLGAQYDDGEALWLGAWAYLSSKGEASARLAGYYNRKLAGPLIIQPSAELDYYGEDMPELGLGRGFGYAEAGLRLRYEVKEAFAPYVGLSWSRDLGRTARLTRAEGEDPETKSVVMGVRSSF
ncbi:MAG TPA: copper resistance protein B [Allosphingosinicella sp.]|jgi:copper resistance protein B|nr:copper resistance protein B [Allosphingosinicella sp.]